MAKQMFVGEEARRKIAAGIETVAQAVKVTLGPTGKNVIFQKGSDTPRSTKDGVTVAKEIELKDPFENMGAKMIHEVADKANDAVGDGTTTAVIYAEAMLKEGFKLIAAGYDPQGIRRGIEKAVDRAIDEIDKLAFPVKDEDDIRRVGTIASNNQQKIGDLFAEAMQKVGENGVITVEEGKRTETVLDLVQGMQLDRGYLSPYFVTDRKNMECVLEDPYIFLYEKKLSSAKELIPLLEQVASSGKPVLIVAEDVEGEALAALILNRLQGTLKVAAIKAPGFGDRRKAMMEDISILTDAAFVSEESGIQLEKVDTSHLGTAGKVVITKEKITMYEGGGNQKKVQKRIDQIKRQMEETSSQYDLEKLQERLAKLSGGVAIISVGGMSEQEVKERKDRVEDALNATQAAVQEGIIAGGGTIGVRVKQQLEKQRFKSDEKMGLQIVLKALEAPIQQIARNVGMDPGMVLTEIREEKGNVGFNAMTGEYTDLVKAGVVDPVKVMRVALQSAASIAALNIGTSTTITDLEDGEDPISGAVA